MATAPPIGTLTIQVHDNETGKSWERTFDRSPVKVGRNLQNDLPLDTRAVSGWHAMVLFDGPNVTVVDLGSTNGTFVGGERLKTNAPTPLTSSPNTPFVIGTLELRAQAHAPGARSATKPASAQPQLPRTIQQLPGQDVQEPQPVPPPAADTNPREQPVPIPPCAPDKELDTLFARLFPEESTPTDPAQRARLLTNIEATLRSCAQVAIASEREQDQLEEELNVPRFQEGSPIAAARSEADVLRYVLHWESDENQRLHELEDSYRINMVQTRAVLAASLSGLRSSLRTLDPQSLLHQSGEKAGANAWKSFEKKYCELEDDTNLRSTYFGEDFRATYISTGKNLIQEIDP